MLDSSPLETMLPASDLDRARQWYREKLDLKPVEEDEVAQAITFETGGTRWAVYRSDFAGSNQGTAAGFVVDDVSATVAELRGRGVVFEDYDFGDDFRTQDGIFKAPNGESVAWFKDSEGNILAVADRP